MQRNVTADLKCGRLLKLDSNNHSISDVFSSKISVKYMRHVDTSHSIV